MPSSLVVRQNVNLAPYTTLGLGGAAHYFALCQTEDQILEALTFAQSHGLRVFVLGGGSNTIFSDAGFDGLIIKISIKGLTYVPQDEIVLARASAGVDWDAFIQKCVARGLGGVECLSGIPGLVGATPVQNVGAYGQEVAETIVSVEGLDRTTQERVTFTAADCKFGYRMSRFKSGDANRIIITAVTFSLTPNAPAVIRYPELQRHVEGTVDLGLLKAGVKALTAVRAVVLQLRRRKSMVIDPDDPHTRSVGSFFMNPVVTQAEFDNVQSRWKAMGEIDPVPHYPAGGKVKIPAAWLVEKCGFPKGFRQGGAGVSANHSLALVNYGCTTQELLALASMIEVGVREKFAIQLQREPIVVE
jgi:UDP-N-acetylmuramate dehydrogenase